MPSSDRESKIRAYAEKVIAERGEVPTVREVLREVGGKARLITDRLREYRQSSRKDGRRPVAPASASESSKPDS
jgi:hypothetical protein